MLTHIYQEPLFLLSLDVVDTGAVGRVGLMAAMVWEFVYDDGSDPWIKSKYFFFHLSTCGMMNLGVFWCGHCWIAPFLGQGVLRIWIGRLLRGFGFLSGLKGLPMFVGSIPHVFRFQLPECQVWIEILCLLVTCWHIKFVWWCFFSPHPFIFIIITLVPWHSHEKNRIFSIDSHISKKT